MNLSGEYRINAQRDVVWQALNDPAVLRQAIPGCETVEQESSTAFTARVKAKIGPVSAVFTGRVELKDLDPPGGCVLSAEGKGGAAGFASGDARITLLEDGQGTLLRYEAEGKVGGKLAQVGARLVEASATKIANTFFSRLDGLVAVPETLPPAAAERSLPAGRRMPEVFLERVFIALVVAAVGSLGIVAAFLQ
ncbi:MAG: carbon monoxide dehydrogenase subunit G [bacterium]|nr:carbon monoxide dehydrogenase subunit G [bacterium]MDE0239020.1 carbon monoxide dehydrogenase subunit G [bacterium]MDE0416375.1 carbon monoxide dehydrogenase subunit G [bacterium]